MSKKNTIVLILEFDKSKPFEDEDYEEVSLSKIKLGKDTTLSAAERDALTERWGQSDEFWTEIPTDILHVIDTGDSVKYSG